MRIPSFDLASVTQRRTRQTPRPAAAKTAEKPTAPPVDPEADARESLSALQRAFQDRAAAEKARFMLATDTEYWFCVCFQTREQVEAFLRESGWAPTDSKYIDGRVVARELDISLPPDPKYPKVRALDRDWSRLSM